MKTRVKTLFISSFIFLSSMVSLSASILDRFFEVRFPMNVSFSNNTFFVEDYMKENVVIDLSEIAAAMTPDGFVTNVNIGLNPGIALHTKIFDFGLEIAPDTTGKFQLSKSIFDFLGSGNGNSTPGELFTAGVNASADAFLGINTKLVLKTKKFSLGVAPNLFIPIAAVNTKDYSISVTDVDGKITAKANANLNMYSCLDVNKLTSGNFDASSLPSELFNQVGADLGIIVGYQHNKRLNFETTVRVPVVPGRLYNLMPMSVAWGWDASIEDLMNPVVGEFKAPDIQMGTVVPVEYFINRPLKANLAATWKSPGSFMKLTAGGGVGVRHPFASDTTEIEVYPEYNLGLGLSLFGLIGVNASTEYTDQLFIHKAGVDVNIRLIEVQAGASIVGPTMESSFKVGGLGAYVLVCIGF